MNSEEELELREYESRTQFLVERATAKKAETAAAWNVAQVYFRYNYRSRAFKSRGS